MEKKKNHRFQLILSKNSLTQGQKLMKYYMQRPGIQKDTILDFKEHNFME